MRRVRPGTAGRGSAERALTSVAAGADYADHTADGANTDTDADPGGEGAAAHGDRAARPGDAGVTGGERQPRLWHVTLSASGPPAPLPDIRRGLEQLAHDHPFLLTSRYAEDHAEIRYWEEARDLHDAAAVALRLWGEHRQSARLPAWEIVGLEVIDRDTYHQRVAEGYGPPPAVPVGVHPF
ncbi:hypothetical protein ACX6XY_24910 [Streptomyces sp. O3]